MDNTQSMTDELSNDLDKILEKAFSDVRKKLTTLITKREKRLLKQATAANKTSRAPPRTKQAKTTTTSTTTTKHKHKKKYRSSSSESSNE